MVERYYTYGFYPVWSRILRFSFGWIPFSIGDLFYGGVIFWLIGSVVRLFRKIRNRRINRHAIVTGIRRSFFIALLIYVWFNLSWGLNYSRVGIAGQIGLQVRPYTDQDLDTLALRLKLRLNSYAANVMGMERDSIDQKRSLFRAAHAGYANTAIKYPFLRYTPASVKPSIFSYAGNYLGFQGYYNPFSAEAQVNTTIPGCMQPFVTTHEMAHQLGYGKENEANFVGFLACRNSGSAILLYSAYFDMFNYAYGEVWRRDSLKARKLSADLDPQVKKDIQEYRAFRRRYRNYAEDVVMWGYGHYLQANNQPSGHRTYNEVVGWLVAYYKRFGTEAI